MIASNSARALAIGATLLGTLSLVRSVSSGDDYCVMCPAHPATVCRSTIGGEAGAFVCGIVNSDCEVKRYDKTCPAKARPSPKEAKSAEAKPMVGSCVFKIGETNACLPVDLATCTLLKSHAWDSKVACATAPRDQ